LDIRSKEAGSPDHPEERETRSDIGDAYLFTAIDQDTKLIAAHTLGKRSADNARRFMVQLANRIGHAPSGTCRRCVNFMKHDFPVVVQISTDGFSGYPEAVDLAFGPFAKFGVIIKDYRERHDGLHSIRDGWSASASREADEREASCALSALRTSSETI
jgi:hypothetical protein